MHLALALALGGMARSAAEPRQVARRRIEAASTGKPARGQLTGPSYALDDSKALCFQSRAQGHSYFESPKHWLVAVVCQCKRADSVSF